MYSEFLDDPKITSLAFEDQRHFIGVLAIKCSGSLDQEFSNDDILNRMVSHKLWVDFGLINEIKTRLINASLIDEKWHPLAWDSCQEPTKIDRTKAERQKRYREREKDKKIS